MAYLLIHLLIRLTSLFLAFTRLEFSGDIWKYFDLNKVSIVKLIVLRKVFYCVDNLICYPNLNSQSYVDDVLFSDTLQTLLEVCRAYAGPHDVVYNTTKTICMLVRPKQAGR